MTGINYTVTIEDGELTAALAQLMDKMDNLTPFHKEVGEHLLNSVEDRFDSETAPDGSRWQHHAPATIQSRLRRNGNSPLTILRETGRLAGSFSYEVNSQQTEIGTPVEYAAIHHFGGKAGRNHAVTIPPRPILGLSPDDKSEIQHIAEKYLTK